MVARHVVGPVEEFPPGTHRVVRVGRAEIGAFSPMILRFISGGIGSFRIALGWSKSWWGQSEAKSVRSSPS